MKRPHEDYAETMQIKDVLEIFNHLDKDSFVFLDIPGELVLLPLCKITKDKISNGKSAVVLSVYND